MTKKSKELLKAVVMKVAKNVCDEMMGHLDAGRYQESSEKSDDLARYLRVMQSLDDAIHCQPGLEDEELEHGFFVEGGDWDCVREWIMEDAEWQKIVESVAQSEGLEEYEMEVEDLFLEVTR